MSQRVTRSTTARLHADSSSTLQASPTTATDPESPADPPASRKRKAHDPTPPTAQRELRKTKRPRTSDVEQETPSSPVGQKKTGKKVPAAMSSAGYGDLDLAGGKVADSDRPSSSTSGETSPQQAPRDGSKRKSSRRKSKEGGPVVKADLQAPANLEADPSGSTSASASRKSKKGSKKDHDVPMKDADEKPADTQDNPAEEEASRQDTGGGADGSQDPPRRFTADELDAMERSDDPFMSGYLGRFGGHAGLSSSLRALTGLMSGTSSRLRAILEQLRTKDDPSTQMVALQELSELLLVSNEDNLAGHFAPDQYVKELVKLMQPNEFTGEENSEIMLLACRCIANMMEALPASTASVVYGGAVPVLCQKLLEIHFIDLAEQALSTLEKISVEFPSSIVREGGLTACLTYLDFFATSTQRTAVTTAANCCRNIPEDSFPTVRDVMPILLNTLSSSDQKVVEQASLCVSRVIDSFKYHESKLEELVSPDLLKAILRLLLPGSTNMIGPNIYTQFLRVLSITARASPRLSIELLKMNVVDHLYQILTGVSPPSGTQDAASRIDKNIIMQAIIRTPRDQIFETLNVICELLPSASGEGLSFLGDLVDAGFPGAEHVSMSTRSRKAPNDKKLKLMKDCPEEVRRFAVILFPTLMHAFTSTVNLNVRSKVLTAQLKMLSNFHTDILEDALRGVTYASHLASILTQQENATLVTFALQAAELLLKRLETIYRPQFYREGVMAEIAKLADRPIKADTAPDESAEPGDADDHAPPQVEERDDENDEPAPAEEEAGAIEVDVPAAGEDDEADDDEDPGEDEDENGEHLAIEDEEDEIIGEQDEPSEESEPPSPNKPRRITDLQDIITLRAKRFMEAHGNEGSAEMREKAVFVLDDLRSLTTELKSFYSGVNSQGGVELFQRLAKYFDGDALESITSYELMTSGIVDVLLAIFNDSDEQAATEARSDFLEVFMSTSNPTKIATGTAKSPVTPFSVFVLKLQDLLSRSEHFEVITVHSNAYETNRSSAASMLAKQLRLKLVADEESGIPRHFRNIIVSIHAIATFKALDDYLRPRISMAERPRTGRRDGVTSAMAAYAAAMAGRGERGGPFPPTLPSLGSSLPTRSAAKKVPKVKSSKSDPAPSSDSSKPEDGTSRLRRSSRRHSAQASSAVPPPPPPSAPAAQEDDQGESQEALECADEAHITDEDDDDVEADLDALVDDLEEGGLEQDMPDPSAVNLEVANSGKVTARTEDGDRVSTPSQGAPTPTHRDRLTASHRLALAREMLSTPTSSARPGLSYASALQQTPTDWHIEFSVNDQPVSSETTIYRACHFNQAEGEELSSRTIWSATHTINFKKVQGPPPAASATPPPDASPSQKSDLPPSLDKHPMTASILRLMSILHDLNANLDDVLSENKGTVQLHAEPLAQFVNTKLTAKLNRQLEEPLIVASQCLPTWSEDLARVYPFLFPFETRHLFLQSTSFGYARSMSRWQSSASESELRRHREQPFLGKVQRQKVRISRSRILESAVKVMELYGSSHSVLEVEYFEEVGTGLGPTLEFYSTVSKEFSKKKTKLWRENESFDGDDYAFGRRGLFPAPMDEALSKNENGQRVLHLFKMLGKFVARSMLDSRIIDVSFNPTFFRIGEGASAVVPSLGAVAAVDQDLATSLKILKKYASAKQRIEDDERLSEMQKARKIEGIRINDARIEDLSLDFTLPGHPNIELTPNGSSMSVTIDNVGQYIKKVIDFTLGTGVHRQVEAFRAGFSQVFPYPALRAFTPDELVMLFGRVDEDWSLETLMDSIKADHGFNLDSKSVRNLLQVMSELSPQSKRDFLQFATGSPKLPIGGKLIQHSSKCYYANDIVQVSKLSRQCSPSSARPASLHSPRTTTCRVS